MKRRRSDRLAVRLRKDEKQTIMQLAAQQDCSASQLMRRAIKDFLRQPRDLAAR